jgi:hypothetical protein
LGIDSKLLHGYFRFLILKDFPFSYQGCITMKTISCLLYLPGLIIFVYRHFVLALVSIFAFHRGMIICPHPNHFLFTKRFDFNKITLAGIEV